MSITHFARTAVASVIAFILCGGVAKLLVDSRSLPILAIVGMAVILGLAIFAAVQYVRGRRAQRSEDTRYERMMELRRSLQLDDPAALLPG